MDQQIQRIAQGLTLLAVAGASPLTAVDVLTKEATQEPSAGSDSVML